MCFGKSSSPPTPQSPPAPQPESSATVKAAAEQQKAEQKRQESGFQSTIGTSPQGITTQPTVVRKVLGVGDDSAKKTLGG